MFKKKIESRRVSEANDNGEETVEYSTAIPEPATEGTVGQKTAARNPLFLVFVVHLLSQCYKLPLLLHTKCSMCLKTTERI